MKIDTKFCSVLFCVVFEEILCSESVAAEKTARFCLEFTFFICLLPLCWNSDSENSFVRCRYVCDFWCHSLEIKFSLVMSCPGGPGMVNG